MKEKISAIAEVAKSLANNPASGTSATSRYYFTNAVACLFMALDYLTAYEKSEFAAASEKASPEVAS